MTFTGSPDSPYDRENLAAYITLQLLQCETPEEIDRVLALVKEQARVLMESRHGKR